MPGRGTVQNTNMQNNRAGFGCGLKHYVRKGMMSSVTGRQGSPDASPRAYNSCPEGKGSELRRLEACILILFEL